MLILYAMKVAAAHRIILANIFPTDVIFRALTVHSLDAIAADEFFIMPSVCEAMLVLLELNPEFRLEEKEKDSFVQIFLEKLPFFEKQCTIFPMILHLLNFFLAKGWIGQSLITRICRLSFFTDPRSIQSPHALYTIALVMQMGRGQEIVDTLKPLIGNSESRGLLDNFPVWIVALFIWLESTFFNEIKISPALIQPYISAIRFLLFFNPSGDYMNESCEFIVHITKCAATRDPFSDVNQILGRFTWMEADDYATTHFSRPSSINSFFDFGSILLLCHQIYTIVRQGTDNLVFPLSDGVPFILLCSIYGFSIQYADDTDYSYMFWDTIRALILPYLSKQSSKLSQFEIDYLDALVTTIQMVVIRNHFPPSDDIKSSFIQMLKLVRDQSVQMEKTPLDNNAQSNASKLARSSEFSADDDFMDTDEITVVASDAIENEFSVHPAYVSVSLEQNSLCQIICRCLFLLGHQRTEPINEIIDILSFRDCSRTGMFPSDLYLDICGYLSLHIIDEGVLTLATLNAWDKEVGPLGYVKLLEIILHLCEINATKLITDASMQYKIIEKIIFPEDLMLGKFLQDSWKARYVRMKCALMQPFNDIVKEPLVHTLLEGLTDSDIRIRSLAAHRLPQLLELFPKSHSKIYHTVIETVFRPTDSEICVSSLIAISLMTTESPYLIRSSLRDLLVLCSVNLRDSNIFVSKTRYSLFSRLVEYISSNKKYISIRDFFDDFFGLLLITWIERCSQPLVAFPYFLFGFRSVKLFAEFAAKFLLPAIAQLEQAKRFKFLSELSEMSGYSATDTGLASLLLNNICSLKAAEFFTYADGIKSNSILTTSDNSVFALNIRTLIKRCIDQDITTKHLTKNIATVVEASFIECGIINILN